MAQPFITTARRSLTETDFCTWVGQADSRRHPRVSPGLPRHRHRTRALSTPPSARHFASSPARPLGVRRRSRAPRAAPQRAGRIQLPRGKAAALEGNPGHDLRTRAPRRYLESEWRTRHERASRSPLRHLTQDELAARWRISERTLDRWRALGTGPAWLKLNGRVRYRLEDVEAFERLRLRNS